MIDSVTFRKIKEMQKEGILSSKIMEELHISKSQYYKWGLLTEESFLNHIKDKTSDKMFHYREFILSILSITPQINATNILQRCIDEFDDFDIPRMTFFRQLKNLREETGFVKDKHRQYAITKETLPGERAEVDFGQYKMKTMYGHNKIVYFFCMIMSFSRMKFVYFSPDSFTTKTAVIAHTYAFKFFGGRPQSLLYDQDKLFLVSENFGDFILTKEFEKYVRKIGFTVDFCHKHDPMSKAKVEGTVWAIKHQFLDGRIYNGIDSLNGECLEWLDRFGNGDFSKTTHQIPREMFKEEFPHLVKIRAKDSKVTNESVVSVMSRNRIKYKGNLYFIPPEANLEKCKVKVKEEDGVLYVYRLLTNELVIKHEIPIGQGRVVSTRYENKGDLKLYNHQIDMFFENNKIMKKYMDSSLREGNPEYRVSQSRRIVRMTRYYSKEELLDGMKYCIKVNKCSVYELSSYMIYKYGEDKARVYLHANELSHFKKRSKQIWEEQHNG